MFRDSSAGHTARSAAHPGDARARLAALASRSADGARAPDPPAAFSPADAAMGGDRAAADAGIPRARSGEEPIPADLVDDDPAASPAGDDAALGGWVPGEPADGPEGRSWTARLAESGAWGVLAERWVPEPLRGARIDPGKRGAVLLSSIGALAAVVAAVGVWWARPMPTPLQDAPAAVLSELDGPDAAGEDAAGGLPAAGPAEAAGEPADPVTSSAEPAGPIKVSVTGQVRRPGLVTVPADARVADAISAAGGVQDVALLAGLNLAAHLTDGASVVVGGPGGNAVAAEQAAGAPSAAGLADSALINLNTADAATLQQLSGVGPVTAEAIVAYRTQHGPFTELGQLQDVSGIGPATYARLAPHVTL